MSILNDTSLAGIRELGLGANLPDAKARTKLGQAEFLDLMVAQLRNQDPFEPMENGDFIAQMAQFSQVTGLEELQKSFGQMANSLQSNQALQASTLVGRDVVIPSQQGVLPQGGTLDGFVNLPSGANNLTITIENPLTSQVYQRIELGAQQAGTVPFQWSGVDMDGELRAPGMYRIRATTEEGGQTYEQETLTRASVDSVSLGGSSGGISINLSGFGSMDLSRVREIR